MIAKNGMKYNLDARKHPCMGKGKHVKLLSAKQLCRMVTGKSKTVLVTLQAIKKDFCAEKWNTLQTLGKSSREVYDGVSGRTDGIPA
jgi:hypothetical protein